MENETGRAPNRSFWRWAITPPQSYLIYLVCLVLIFVGSFYAGTLKPKKPTGLGPPPVAAPSVPRNLIFHSSWPGFTRTSTSFHVQEERGCPGPARA